MMSNSRPIKVLFYEFPGPGVGGSRRSLLNLIRGFGHHVEAVVIGDFPQGWVREAPETVSVLPPSRVWPPRAPSRFGRVGRTARWLWYMVTTVLRLLWLIHRRRIDVVHANNDVTSGAPAVVAAKLARRPCVSHLRGEVDPWGETRWLFRLVDHYIAISREVAAFYSRQGLIRSNALSIIHNSVDVEDLERRAERVRRRDGDPWCVGMFGRMVEFKGHEYFVETLARLIKSRTDVRFFVHGPVPTPGDELWPYYDGIRRRVTELQLQDYITFSGPFCDVAQVMRQTDVAICCSPYRNFERIVIEAMASGVPVVAFDVGGMEEMAVHGQNCLLVRNRDSEAMADAVSRLLADGHLCAEIQRGGHETAKRLFDYRANANQVLLVYRRLLAPRKCQA